MTLGRSIWMRVDRIHPHDLHPVGCAGQNPVPNILIAFRLQSIFLMGWGARRSHLPKLLKTKQLSLCEFWT
jgi:hypothetical protein